MCGIVGVLGSSEVSIIKKMLLKIQHRGPDDEGYYINKEDNLAFGHRRLSIIELSAAGHQPMSYHNERYWITFNGEIYNYQSLRDELKAYGKKFRTNSDTEVILAAYSEWGSNFLSKLRGMFAFAIWDNKEKSLFIARDRIGIKPLYYAYVGGTLIFGSEIKSIIGSGIVSNSISNSALIQYFQYGAIAQPNTIYSEIKSLLPGHFFTYSNGSISIEKYWDLYENTRILQENYRNISFKESVQILRKNLEDATTHHLVADVSVGAFLSGGIDSSAIVGLMGRLVKEPIKTYSVGFSQFGEKRNELPYAKKVAEHFRTDHTEIIVTPSDASKYFHTMMEFADQPSSDGLNSFIVSLFAQNGVKVALSGLGGDELFGGYPHFKRIMLASKIFSNGNKHLEYFLKLINSYVPSRFYPLFETIVLSEQERILSLRRLISADNINIFSNKFFSQKEFHENEINRSKYSHHGEKEIAREISYFEFSTYIRDTLLRDADQMSMAHSLEVRPILLDHVLVENSFSIPTKFTFKNGSPKGLFIEAVKDILPPFIYERKKMGFELPLINWLNSDLNEYAKSVFNSKFARNIFNKQYIDCMNRSLKERSVKKNRDWAYFVLLSFIEKNT